MKKKYLMAAAILAFALSVSTCSGKTASITKTTTVPMAEASGEQDSKEQVSREQTDTNPEKENASDTPKGVLTSIVGVNKGLMIIVISDEDSESYVFGLDEKRSGTYKDIKPGDTVSVIYTNGFPSPDNMDMVVTDIKVE